MSYKIAHKIKRVETNIPLNSNWHAIVVASRHVFLDLGESFSPEKDYEDRAASITGHVDLVHAGTTGIGNVYLRARSDAGHVYVEGRLENLSARIVREFLELAESILMHKLQNFVY